MMSVQFHFEFLSIHHDTLEDNDVSYFAEKKSRTT